MDAKITKKRLSQLLTYDWLKIVGLIVAAIIVWTLIFTTTATRMRPSQQFTVFNHHANLALDDSFYNHYASTMTDGTFSYEVIEQNVNDLAANKEYAHTLMEARFATDEGDVMLLPGIDDTGTSYKDETTGETKYRRTYVESMLYSYRQYITDAEKYLSGLESYLNGFYDGGFETGTLNAKKVETAFRARAKANNDKRFKKEAQIKQGIADDIKRIEKYRDALIAFYGYLEDGVIAYVDSELVSDKGEVLVSGKFSIDLCPNEATMGGLKAQYAYQEKFTNDEGKEQVRNTARNMNLIFLKNPGTENGFQYEALLYVVNLINTYYTPAA